MTTATILVSLFAIAFAGGIGYWLSAKFWNTQYSRTNTSGDFGTPRGGFFATLGGVLIGLFFFAYLGKYIFPAETVGTGMIVSMISGAVGGFVAMFRATANRSKK